LIHLALFIFRYFAAAANTPNRASKLFNWGKIISNGTTTKSCTINRDGEKTFYNRKWGIGQRFTEFPDHIKALECLKKCLQVVDNPLIIDYNPEVSTQVVYGDA